MSRSKIGGKSAGAEYWSRRPVSNKHGCSPGKSNKKRTHHAERQGARIQVAESDLEARDLGRNEATEGPRPPRARGTVERQR